MGHTVIYYIFKRSIQSLFKNVIDFTFITKIKNKIIIIIFKFIAKIVNNYKNYY